MREGQDSVSLILFLLLERQEPSLSAARSRAAACIWSIV